MAHDKAFLICESKCLVPSEQVQVIEGFTIATTAWVNKQFTLSNNKIKSEKTICDVYISNASLSVFEKAKIKGRCEAGKLILTYEKAPAANIIVDCIKVVS